MTNELAIQPNEPSAIQLAGAAANASAARYVFEDYRRKRADNTTRRQRADLELLTRYLGSVGVLNAALDQDTKEAATNRRQYAEQYQNDPDTWRGMTWGLIAGFVRWQMQRGYAIASINVRLSTVKKYAALALQAGTIDATEYALIKTVQGHKHSEGKNEDKRREAEGINTRFDQKGAKKAESVSIPYDIAKSLKHADQDTPQSRRDALLMCLLLDHGLRCGEVALLTVGNFNQADGTMTFFRPKVDKVQTHTLTADTRRALNAWIESGDCSLPADAKILRGSTKGGKLTNAGMTERAITKRVAYLGKQHGISGLSAHDCRHYWATRASRKGTDPFSLQEAGGWNSLAMPRRYVEAAKIANEGVKLD